MTDCDVIVHGGTPGGIACAVRAAREGLRVLLVNRTPILGGMLANGLSLWDTFYDGPRAPIFDEFAQAIREHYRVTYGDSSPPYKAACPGPRLLEHATGAFEPSVAQRIAERMVAAEKNITLMKRAEVVQVKRQANRIVAVRIEPVDGGHAEAWPADSEGRASARPWVSAATFVDATYEGDLLARAGVPYRVGREGRAEFGEPHAGKIFARKIMARSPEGFATSPREAFEGKLNLRTWHNPTVEILPASTGEADHAVQAYNYRLCVTNRADIRRLPDKPANYDRRQYLHLSPKARLGAIGVVNGKGGWNLGRPIGWNFEYPDAGWPKREAIMRRYLDYALGMMFFLQNDDAIEPATRELNRQWGLAADEFTDNDNIPYEFYARETRRLVGRYVFTEHDGVCAPDCDRPPSHADSIAFTDWPLDSVQCLPQSIVHKGETIPEGAFFLSEESRPGQVPYRCLLPQELDNLLVPVCLSATHVGWGALRVEPTWMHIGESAGFAAAQAQRHRQAVAEIDVIELRRTLAQRGVLTSWYDEACTGVHGNKGAHDEPRRTNVSAGAGNPCRPDRSSRNHVGRPDANADARYRAR